MLPDRLPFTSIRNHQPSLLTATAATLFAAAWGDEHDAFKELATTVGESDTSLLVVGVPISNSDTYPVNTKLSVRAS